MKLVEILARELSEWPEDVMSMGQDADLQVSHYESKDQIWSDNLGAWNNDGYVPCSRFTTAFATDHATAIVTREMWEAERERVQDVELHGPFSPYDGPEIDTDSFFPSGTISLCIDPRNNRDRIRAIDTQLADLTLERAERIAELADEGFALLPVMGVVGPAGDMEDWRNWQVGDMLEIESCKHGHDFHNGEIVIIESIECKEPYEDCRFKCRGDQDFWFVGESECIFHSRPKPC